VSCSEPASGASARYQRGRPRTRTHKALTTLAAFSLRDTSASHGCSARFTRFTSDDQLNQHSIPSCARRAVPGGGRRGSPRRPTRSRLDAGPQVARHQNQFGCRRAGVECDLCGVCPTTGVRAQFSGNFDLSPPCVCGSRCGVGSMSDLPQRAGSRNAQGRNAVVYE